MEGGWKAAAGAADPAGEALARFSAPRNAEYLRGAGGGRAAPGALAAFAAGRGRELLRAAPVPPRDPWEGVRLLNRAYLEEGASAAAEARAPPEPYHIREFERDSLPRGLPPPPRQGAEDAWEEGRAERSAEEAWAEYYGEDWAASEVRAGPGPGRAREGLAPGRDRWARPVPAWQKASKGPRPEAGFVRAREGGGQARGWGGKGGRAWEVR